MKIDKTNKGSIHENGKCNNVTKGKFMKRKTITFLIARKIGRFGIQGISFFQKPLGLGLKEFGKDLLGNVKEDIINSLTTVK